MTCLKCHVNEKIKSASDGFKTTANFCKCSQSELNQFNFAFNVNIGGDIQSNEIIRSFSLLKHGKSKNDIDFHLLKQ